MQRCAAQCASQWPCKRPAPCAPPAGSWRLPHLHQQGAAQPRDGSAARPSVRRRGFYPRLRQRDAGRLAPPHRRAAGRGAAAGPLPCGALRPPGACNDPFCARQEEPGAAPRPPEAHTHWRSRPPSLAHHCHASVSQSVGLRTQKESALLPAPSWPHPYPLPPTPCPLPLLHRSPSRRSPLLRTRAPARARLPQPARPSCSRPRAWGAWDTTSTAPPSRMTPPPPSLWPR